MAWRADGLHGAKAEPGPGGRVTQIVAWQETVGTGVRHGPWVAWHRVPQLPSGVRGRAVRPGGGGGGGGAGLGAFRSVVGTWHQKRHFVRPRLLACICPLDVSAFC